MTVKEAILTLNVNAVIACERAGFSSTIVKMIEDALDTIEDALKAQEPVLVKPYTEVEYGFKPKVKVGKCPNCGRIVNEQCNYCSKCGKAVKWE